MNKTSREEKEPIFKDKLYRFALKYLPSKEEAADLVQETLLRMYEKLTDKQEIINTEAWSMRTIRNLALDRLKSASVKRTEGYPENPFYVTPDSNPQESAEWKDIKEKIDQAIFSLPQLQKEVIHLRDVEGYSYEEISEMVGTSLSNVKVSLFRARQSVRQSLEKLEIYEFKR